MTSQSRLMLLMPVVALAGLMPRVAMAQVVVQQAVALTDSNPAPAADNAPAFSVRKEQDDVVNAFEDFDRFRDKKAWEKAFTALTKVPEGDDGRLVRTPSGFFMPTAGRVQDELLSLPPDGREAYRLFNDAKAQQMLKSATGAVDERQQLIKLVDRYFITSAGDQAADRLGDAWFESGDFATAGRCWRLVVENFPDTSIPMALLQTKRAVAAARLKDWGLFTELQADVKTRFPGQKVIIGGQSVDAVEFLTDLQFKLQADVSPTGIKPVGFVSSFFPNGGGAAPAALPVDDTPKWQMPLMDADAVQQLNAQLSQNGWNLMAGMFDEAVPATAVDDDRVYVDWLGICFAMDSRTGKVLWRTDSFGDMNQKMVTTISQGQAIDSSIFSCQLLGSDHVLFTRRSTDNQNYNDLPMTRLLCLDRKSGTAVWKSESGSLAGWGVIGVPLVDGDTMYLVAHAAGSQEMNLLAVSIDKGVLQWKLLLGTPAASTDYRGVPTVPPPTLLKNRDKLFVLTNNGALVETDLADHKIDWSFGYHTTVEQQRNYWASFSAPSAVAPGSIVVAGQTLYFKESKNNCLYAIDPSGPSLKWKRPVDAENTIVQADADHLLLFGLSVQALDGRTRDMQWDVPVPIGTPSMGPLLLGRQMLVFNRRGVQQIDLATGDTSIKFRGYDRDSAGGRIWKTSDRLVTVSSRAITAYELPAGR